MNLTSPVRLSLALCFALFAICGYVLLPDSKNVSSPEPPVARTSPAILAGSLETTTASSSESPAPSGPAGLANPRLPAGIVPTSSPATEIPPNSAAAAPLEIRMAPEQTLTNSVQTPPDISDAPSAAAAPRALPRAAQVPVPFATVSAAPPPSTQAAAEPLPLAKFPAAFIEPDPETPLTETQSETVKVLQKEFIDAIGGPDQDPADPEYFRRWHTAKWESDQRFKTLFGVQAFLARERAANTAGVGTGGQ